MSGNPLPDDVQAKMEKSFGTDFSSVRVHTNSGKPADVGALAYTQGNDIHFAPGQYSPDTSHGQALLGHELTHVVQQKAGANVDSPVKAAERKLSGYLAADGATAAVK